MKTGCRSHHNTAAYRAQLHALVLLCDQTDIRNGSTSSRLGVNERGCLNADTTVPNPPDVSLLYANILVSAVWLQQSFHGQERATGCLLSPRSSLSSWIGPARSVCYTLAQQRDHLSSQCSSFTSEAEMTKMGLNAGVDSLGLNAAALASVHLITLLNRPIPSPPRPSPQHTAL